MPVRMFGGVPVNESRADSYYMHMTKAALVKYIRNLEHNLKSLGERFDRQTAILDKGLQLENGTWHCVPQYAGYQCSNCANICVGNNVIRYHYCPTAELLWG